MRQVRPPRHWRVCRCLRFLKLNAYPEVAETLARLKAGGMQLAILSNGSPGMLASAVDHAGVGHLLEAVPSAEEVGAFKPHPAVYQFAVDRLRVRPDQICFVSSNAWDAFSAKAFGFRVAWCNRFGQAPERIPERPDGEIGKLSALPEIVGT